jgi:hypothetical protein
MALPAVMAISISAHPVEDCLEAYVMGRLPVTDEARLEEHILICSRCCETLDEAIGYIDALKRVLTDARLGTENEWSPISHGAIDMDGQSAPDG